MPRLQVMYIADVEDVHIGSSEVHAPARGVLRPAERLGCVADPGCIASTQHRRLGRDQQSERWRCGALGMGVCRSAP